jgi:hypothetical protein
VLPITQSNEDRTFRKDKSKRNMIDLISMINLNKYEDKSSRDCYKSMAIAFVCRIVKSKNTFSLKFEVDQNSRKTRSFSVVNPLPNQLGVVVFFVKATYKYISQQNSFEKNYEFSD